jgi:hypothetical protein
LIQHYLDRGTDTAFAGYSAGLAVPTPTVETFSLGWSSNQNYITTLSLTEAASYGPNPYEDFETGWGNDTYKTDLVSGVDTVVATYGSNPYEDFETGWGNTTYLDTFSLGVDTEAAVYDVYAPLTGQPYEDFEEVFAPVAITAVDPALDQLTQYPPNSIAHDATVYLRNDSGGYLPGNTYRDMRYYVNDIDGSHIHLATTSFSGGASPMDITSEGDPGTYVVGDPRRYWNVDG